MKAAVSSSGRRARRGGAAFVPAPAERKCETSTRARLVADRDDRRWARDRRRGVLRTETAGCLSGRGCRSHGKACRAGKADSVGEGGFDASPLPARSSVPDRARALARGAGLDRATLAAAQPSRARPNGRRGWVPGGHWSTSEPVTEQDRRRNLVAPRIEVRRVRDGKLLLPGGSWRWERRVRKRLPGRNFYVQSAFVSHRCVLRAVRAGDEAPAPASPTGPMTASWESTAPTGPTCSARRSRTAASASRTRLRAGLDPTRAARHGRSTSCRSSAGDLGLLCPEHAEQRPASPDDPDR